MGDQLYLTDPTEKVPHFITTEAEVIFLNQKESCNTPSMRVNYHLLFFLVKDIEQNYFLFNPLNAELNPICPLLTLFGAHHILLFSR
jgi:hypothetical protein